MLDLLFTHGKQGVHDILQFSEQQPHVVIVEDDQVLLEFLVSYFKQNNFHVSHFSSTIGVIDWVKKQMVDPLARLDVIISDVELPNGSGLEILEKLHGFTGLGKILISVRNEEADRIKGLKLGADDYVCKPLNPEELLLRTQSLIRKLGFTTYNPDRESYIQFGRCLLHPETRLLLFEQRKLLLTEGELQILLSLIGRQGKIVSRDELAMSLGKKAINLSSRSIDVLVGRLRRKLEDSARIPEQIITCRGKGYMLSSSE
ncbi:response regulator transcription factor [Thalassotalea fusca]